MGTTACKILDALSTQLDLIAMKEHISVDPDILPVLGVAVGQQVRIVRSPFFGLYTITSSRQEKKNTDMRMDDVGRERLGTTTTFSGSCDSACVKNALTDVELQAQGEYGERLSDEGTGGLVILAPHGGLIENYTDEEAERCFSQLQAQAKPCSSWRAKGWGSGDQGAFARWHITSTELNGVSLPLLGTLEARAKYAYGVSFHGYSLEDIAVGGAAPLALKQEVANAIQSVVGADYAVTVVDSGPYAGTDPANIVNRLTQNGGVQIEQPSGARSAYWVQIADAVASVFAPKL